MSLIFHSLIRIQFHCDFSLNQRHVRTSVWRVFNAENCGRHIFSSSFEIYEADSLLGTSLPMSHYEFTVTVSSRVFCLGVRQLPDYTPSKRILRVVR
jgi:hypothetical protein